METLLAIGIIGVLMSIFLTLFVPARNIVREALAREEMERITKVLRSEMTTLRANEIAPANAKKSSGKSFVSGFDKAFYWFKRSNKPYNSIVIFSYRADTSRAKLADGNYPPVAPGKNIAADKTELITMACPLDDKLRRDSIRNAVGPVFLVRLTQFIEQNGGKFKAARNAGEIAQAGSPEDYLSSANDPNPWGAVVLYQAEFYRLTPPDPQRYRRKTWRNMEKPLFQVSGSFRR